MNVRLTSQQRDMLIEVKDRFKWKISLVFEMRGTNFELKNIDEDDAIDLRELCSDYLLEIGFGPEYFVNEKGEILEQLVDKLYVE